MAKRTPSEQMSADNSVQEYKTFLVRQGTNTGAFALAKSCTILLRNIVAMHKWSTAKDLMALIRAAGKELDDARAGESAVGNMIKRVLRLVREAYAQCVREEKGAGVETMASLHNMLVSRDSRADYDHPFKSLKSNVIVSIGELLEDLEMAAKDIAEQAKDHIHADEVIMTLGHSHTVEAFLKEASNSRSFHVIVAEGAPQYQGQQMAMNLGKAGIETTLITDSAIYAIMSRVNKVIIGTAGVMADGGLMAMSGSHALCMAAKHHSVPVLVCSAMFKLCPKYLCSYDQDAFNNLGSPASIFDHSGGDLIDKISVVTPLYDYVPPDLVTLFISNLGGNAPSYVYRLLSEYYHEDDYEL
ncbi:uncharacterized protein MONBRDRAFT_38213 [Monosiga brevicollis MX1]|uniref:Translation initiation factor eIF2B subunit beta n=1 Tax=Monosiga brevicollis TaxID=81824 RepID=A9V6C1_MONBE|nr:uncharacterized protein MONBRDRAFT_38213 [Monosiga brevicollis MX1]EDQ86966.1 predicted protein [Monosiga brevicollis MX1]|eukprot:XP_001748205.1 hypothetical protein [Monosiga brevicollis MX1]